MDSLIVTSRKLDISCESEYIAYSQAILAPDAKDISEQDVIVLTFWGDWAVS